MTYLLHYSHTKALKDNKKVIHSHMIKIMTLTLTDFLKCFKQKACEGKVHFVLGNSSADMDSIASSIALAYLLHKETGNSYIPLINLPVQDLKLRQDVLYLFDFLNLPTEDLLFIDDSIFLDNIHLVLVDHNVLAPKQKHLSEVVEEIIDHHFDASISYPNLKSKLIAQVGSTSTLIAERYIQSKTPFSKEIASLLLAAILLDTSDLQSKEKTTSRDREMALQLKIACTPPQNFYQNLRDSKNAVADLTPDLLLRKDFKEYLEGDILYGISSLPSSVEWQQQDTIHLEPVLKHFAEERHLQCLFVLMSSNEPLTCRKLWIYSPFPDRLKTFDDTMEKEALKELFTREAKTQYFIFYRSTKAIARKQLQPLLNLRTL